jgi:RimJ/RimL family protein N-acetyltransferase
VKPNFWEGKRVRLRAVEPADWEHFYLWNDDTLFARVTDRVWFPQSREAVKRWAAEQALSVPKNDAFRWVIEDLAGAFVGTINTHNCDRREGTFRYGLAIIREHWRKGYASEAVRLVLTYYFHELAYQKVNVEIYDFNQGSVVLHERLGFQHEGRQRRMGYTRGAYFDWILMGMTREEFDALLAENLE